MAGSSNVGASYPVFVHRLALLLHASFGPSVAGTPLRFANPSPPSGWVEDFHFRAAGHARHTSKTAPLLSRLRIVSCACRCLQSGQPVVGPLGPPKRQRRFLTMR